MYQREIWLKTILQRPIPKDSSSPPTDISPTPQVHKQPVPAWLTFCKQPCSPELESFAFHTNTCAAFCLSPCSQKVATTFIFRRPYRMERGGECVPLGRCHLISHGLQEHSQLLVLHWVDKSNPQLAKAATVLIKTKCTTENNFPAHSQKQSSLSTDPRETKRKRYMCSCKSMMSNTSH